MTEAELKKHLDAAEKSPKQIAAAVSGLPNNILRYKPAPEKWCILEILAHLIRPDLFPPPEGELAEDRAWARLE